eukprot:jgi/Psemu1/289476/fgenesh1_pg.360_\
MHHDFNTIVNLNGLDEIGPNAPDDKKVTHMAETVPHNATVLLDGTIAGTVCKPIDNTATDPVPTPTTPSTTATDEVFDTADHNPHKTAGATTDTHVHKMTGSKHKCVTGKTHHSAINKTPFQAWNGCKADLHRLHTFGTLVMVKRSGSFPSKAPPHVYHCIFLCFMSTTKNMAYYDINSGNVKVATHKTHNEFQYSSDGHHQQSHASRYLLNLIKEDPKQKQYGDPRIKAPITNLIAMNDTPTIAAATKALAMDYPITASPGSLRDSDCPYTYLLGGHYRVLPETPKAIISKLDMPNPTNDDYPLICCAKQRILKDLDILQLQMSLNIHEPSSMVLVSLNGNDTSCGFISHNRLTSPTILDCCTHTLAAFIDRGRSRFHNGTICTINNERILTVTQLTTCIAELRQQKQETCDISFAHEDFVDLHTATGIPQLHFDQLKAIAHHLHSIKYADSPIDDDDALVHQATANGFIPKQTDTLDGTKAT